MTRSISLRKASLTAHIAFSVAWFGAIASFLILAIAGVTSANNEIVRSSYIVMELIGWYSIVPFCIAALITGIIQSCATPWGLFKHYWVAVKLGLTLLSTVLLFVHMNPISYVASVAMQNGLTDENTGKLRIQLLADAGVAMLILLCITAISVYKPWGKIKPSEKGTRFPAYQWLQLKPASPRLFYLTIALIIIVVITFIIMHLFKGGMAAH